MFGFFGITLTVHFWLFYNILKSIFVDSLNFTASVLHITVSMPLLLHPSPTLFQDANIEGRDWAMVMGICLIEY